MRVRLGNTQGALATLALAVAAAACSGPLPTSPSAGGSTTANRITVSGPNPRYADVEFVEICKDYPGGTGPTVTFNITVDVDTDGSIDQSFTETLAAGQCKDVWLGDGQIEDTVTVTEVVPAGYTASYVRSRNQSGTVTTEASVTGNSSTGLTKSGLGYLIVFTNTPDSPPPPPGTQGCTPGYWKQQQHFDSWASPYSPSTLFSDVFENAFPGKTLLEVASLGGGGLNALGRHTVAALLNAASSAVSFGMTPTEVIAAFNAVYPNGDYETLKNQWDLWNNRGCPLN